MKSMTDPNRLSKALHKGAKIAICCVCLSLGSGHQAFADNTIYLATSVNYPYVSEGEKEGFLSLLMADVFARAGLQIRIVRTPGERSLINANKGIDDGDLVRTPGMERLFPNLIMVPEESMPFEIMAYSNPGSGITIQGWDSLKPYRVGLINNWKILERNTTKVRSRVGVRTIELLFGLLKNQRTDIVLIDRLEGLYVSQKLGIPVEMHEPPLVMAPSHIYLNKRHAKLVPLISAALVATKKDGTYDRLLKQALKPLGKLYPNVESGN